MLSFESVLNVFDDYLQIDPLYEVVLTSHGYTLLAWEPARNNWYSAELVTAPGILLDKLVDAYASYLEDRITVNKRELTLTETAEIESQCKLIRERCQTE